MWIALTGLVGIVMFLAGCWLGYEFERKRWMDWLLARLNDRSVAHETAESHP